MAKQIREWLSDVTGVQLPDIGLGPGGVKDIKPPKVTTAPGQIGVTFGDKTYATQQSTVMLVALAVLGGLLIFSVARR